VILVAPLAYYAQFSGSLQWIVGLASLALLAGFAVRAIFRGTSEPAPLVEPAAGDRTTPGEMDRLAASMGRAMRGLRYSQVVVTSRARAAFMERARLALGWDPDRMQAVQGDREALGRLFGDELADFLYLRTGDLEERFPSAFQTPGRGAFVKEFGEILAKMEAWR
jgi:hypothetical protein